MTAAFRLLVPFMMAAAGCSSGQSHRVDADTLSRRARDSAIGASKLPGAAGVRGALRGADSAAARRQIEDSIARTP